MRLSKKQHPLRPLKGELNMEEIEAKRPHLSSPKGREMEKIKATNDV